MTRPSLVLASTSRYRRDLLERLGIPFSSCDPGTREDVLEGESSRDRSVRLARTKAEDAVNKVSAGDWIIGSDQVADLDGVALGKPGTLERGVAQLQRCSGREVVFHTAVCLLRAGTERLLEHVDRTVVRFRPLTDAEIHRYLAVDQSLDCAGSFRCESLGISLFEAIENRDPTALVGLPLIAVSGMLRQAGFDCP